MNSPEISEKCQKCLDAIMSGQLPDREMQAHMASCQACIQAVHTLESLKREDSAFSHESYPELKLKIMRRLEPVLEKSRMAQVHEKTCFSWSLLFRTSFAIAVVMLVCFSLFIGRGPAIVVSPPEVDLAETATRADSFMLALNGKEATQISLDNPVSVFAGETAEITVPDGSKLKVVGPARLTVAQRGFHLLQGRLQASVVKGAGEFIGTTPHGQIVVLGTVFICETDARKTLVEVVSGKVKVTADGSEPKLLSAGEKIEMCQSGAVSTETETIPAIDSE